MKTIFVELLDIVEIFIHISHGPFYTFEINMQLRKQTDMTNSISKDAFGIILIGNKYSTRNSSKRPYYSNKSPTKHNIS